MKRWSLVLIIAVLLSGVAYLLWPAPQGVLIGQQTYQLELATTPSQLTQGLGGRESLPANQGLVLVFEHDGQHGIWMREMQFSLDVIWLDANFVVVDLVTNISPDSYPTAYYPNQPSRYVIELNAGQIAGNNLQVGQVIDLQKLLD